MNRCYWVFLMAMARMDTTVLDTPAIRYFTEPVSLYCFNFSISLLYIMNYIIKYIKLFLSVLLFSCQVRLWNT